MLKKTLCLGFVFMAFVPSCTTQPGQERIPSLAMPFVMALEIYKDGLFVAATNYDGKYGSGKLASVTASSGTIRNEYEIYSDSQNVKIFNETLLITSKEHNTLSAINMAGGNINCGNATAKLTDCANASTYKLRHSDPFALALLDSNAANTYVLSAYLSSEKIDLFKISKTPSISLVNSIDAKSFITGLDSNYSVSTAQIKNSNNKIFILLNAHEEKTKELDRELSLKSYLVEISSADLLLGNRQNAKVRDLSVFGIKQANDFYVSNTHLWLLSQNPSGLYKINLSNDFLENQVSVCSSAKMMAANETKDILILPCFEQNIVQSFFMNTLQVKKVANIKKKSPAYAAIDESNNLIFVSYFEEHQVGVFDMNLNFLKMLFKKTLN